MALKTQWVDLRLTQQVRIVAAVRLVAVAAAQIEGGLMEVGLLDLFGLIAMAR